MEEGERFLFGIGHRFRRSGVQPFGKGCTASRKSERSRMLLELVSNVGSEPRCGADVHGGRGPAVGKWNGGSELGPLEEAFWRRHFRGKSNSLCGRKTVYGHWGHASVVRLPRSKR